MIALTHDCPGRCMSDDEHRELADALLAARAAVVLSGYPSDLYDQDLYADWHRHEIVTGTGQGPDGWANRTEVLWSNRPLGAQPSLFCDPTPYDPGDHIPAATLTGGHL